MKTIINRKTVLAFFLFPAFAFAGTGTDTANAGPAFPAEILGRYLQASQSQSTNASQRPVELDINASLPKLNKKGQLRALRMISEVGKTTYRVLGFQGDNTVKNQVIARYLQAEQQGQGSQDMAVAPANYKFKYKGQRAAADGRTVYVFQLSPRKKRVGLFKGELWLDSGSYLPLYEKGRLVKNPTIFFKKVDFERAFVIRDGIAVPAHMTSTIDARIVGKIVLDVSYLDAPQPDSTGTETAQLTPLSAR